MTDDIELWVTPAAYQELMEADRMERGLSMFCQSSGAALRGELLRYLPQKVVDSLPNPVVVKVKQSLPQAVMSVCNPRLCEAIAHD